jgi:PAS domain S-box-containing protein
MFLGPLRYAMGVLFFIVAYVVLAKSCLAFAIPPGNATAVWPGAGLAVAALLLLGCRTWPAVWIASAITNLTTSVSPAVAVSIASGNTLEAFLACCLIQRFLSVDAPFSKVRDSILFVAVSIGSCAVAASVGTASLWMAGLLTEQQVGPNWWTWWLGDLASLMVLVPLVLAYRQRTWRPLSPARWLELALLFVCVLAAGQFIFGGWLPENSADNLVYLTMILLVWASLRFDLAAVTTCTLLLCGAAVYGVYQGSVRLEPAALHPSLFRVQVFTNVFALTGLTLASLVTQRREAALAAQTSHRQLRSEISERERMQKWFRKLLDSTPDATLLTRQDGIIVLVNEAGERMFGYPPEALIGESIQVLVPDEHRPSHHQHVAKYQSDPRIRMMGAGLELSARRQDGHVFPVEISLGPMQTDEGLFVFCSVRDITQRKLAETALRESQERFDLAVRGTDAGIWDWDLRTDAVFFSPRWKSMLGYQEHELEHNFSEWESRLHPDDRERARTTIREYLDGQRAEYELEHRLRHKDGTYRWILARGAGVRNERGKVYRMVGSHLDLTDRKTAEETLRKQEAQLLAAAEIQKQLLPQAAPKLPGFDIAGRCYPADFAAGDHFDFLWLPDGSLVLTLADVSGHGVGPAMITASFHARFHSLAEISSDLVQIMRILNARLYGETAGEMFVTTITGRIDPQARTLACVNAGHPPGYLLDASGAVKRQFDSTSVPLAILPAVDLAISEPVQLEDHDLIFLYTDGLTEAHRSQEPMFGSERALQVIREHRQKTAAEIVDAVYAAICQRLGMSKPHDDITLIVAKVVP